MTGPMLPEPCDRAEPEPRTVPPLGPWDTLGQLTDRERAHLTTINPPREYL